jgi:hypothetical protein
LNRRSKQRLLLEMLLIYEANFCRAFFLLIKPAKK